MSLSPQDFPRDEQGRVIPGPGPILPGLETLRSQGPRDGFILFHGEDGRSYAIRASRVKSINATAEGVGRGTAIVVCDSDGFFTAAEPVEDLVAQLNIILGHTAAEVVPRRTAANTRRERTPFD